MMSNMAIRDIDWKALEDTPTLTWGTMGLEFPTPTTPINSSTLGPRRSRRIIMQLDWFMYLEEFFKTIPEEHQTDPIYYDEGISSDDVILCQGTMEVESESIYSSEVWDLVEALEMIKPIRCCKLVCKRKRGVDGKFLTYKVRMVAKGYSKKYGFDYEETFALVAMLKSIRILLSIVMHLIMRYGKQISRQHS